MTLGFKFQPLLRTEGFKICGTLKGIPKLAVQLGREHVKNYRSVQCTDIGIEVLKVLIFNTKLYL
jgi:hypothetical protein